MAVLYYFDGRGRGEIVRMMLCAANVQFSESHIKNREEFLKVVQDKNLIFKQLPMLEMDGKCLVQTKAILQYIAETTGMVPKSVDDKYRVDMLFEASRDFHMAFLPIGFRDEAEVLKQAEEKVLPKMLPAFDKILENSKSGYLVGDSISLADVGLLEALLSCIDYFDTKVLSNYSNLQKYVEFLKSLVEIQHYITKVRKRPNDEKYIQEVQNSIIEIK